jgi:long-chain-fatty-acid--CoA ligase ACSBG
METDYRGDVINISSEGYKNLIGNSNGKGIYWTTDVKTELPIRMPTTGTASTLKPTTLSDRFVMMCKQQKKKPALKVMRNGKEQVWSYDQLYRDSFSFAKGMIRLGVEERKAVNIMGFNAPEWAIAFYAGILAHNVVSGVYITNGADACQY